MRRAALIAPLLLAACGGALVPTPEVGPHVGELPIAVPYPAPPARVEIIPDAPPDKGAVWVDGQWLYQSHRWVWTAGSWVVPQPDAYYAPPASVRLADGTLMWFRGTWHAPQRPGVIMPAQP